MGEVRRIMLNRREMVKGVVAAGIAPTFLLLRGSKEPPLLRTKRLDKVLVGCTSYDLAQAKGYSVELSKIICGVIQHSEVDFIDSMKTLSDTHILCLNNTHLIDERYNRVLRFISLTLQKIKRLDIYDSPIGFCRPCYKRQERSIVNKDGVSLNPEIYLIKEGNNYEDFMWLDYNTRTHKWRGEELGAAYCMHYFSLEFLKCGELR